MSSSSLTTPTLASCSGTAVLTVPHGVATEGFTLSVEDASGASVGVRLTPTTGATLFCRASPHASTTVLATCPAPAPPPPPAADAHQGAAIVHWLSFEAASSSSSPRLAYGRGTAVAHPGAALGVVDLPPGTPPLARAPGGLARCNVRVAVEGSGSAPPPTLASPFTARQAGRGAPSPILTLSPHPMPSTALSPLAAPAGWPASLDSLADPASPVPAALLPPTCRSLVEVLASPGLGGLPPSLSAAISHSLASPRGILTRTLAAKAARGAPPYIRVSVAPPRAGCVAPGAPFVLELWPAGSASPIHGHGGCCGGFLVLAGACTLRTYNSLDGGGGGGASGVSGPSEPRPPLFEGTCTPGMVGWFDHTRHQVHAIAAAVPLDPPGAFCATLQAFRYDPSDDVASPFMEVEVDDRAGGGRGGVPAAPAAPAPAVVVCDVDPESDFDFPALAAALLAEHSAGGGGGGGGCGVGAGGGAVALSAAAGPALPAAAAAPPVSQAGEEEDGGEAARFVWVI